MSKGSKKKESRGAARRRETEKTRQTGYIILAVVVVAIIAVSAVVFLHGSGTTSTTSSGTTFSNPSHKPVILYVNQGNGVVNRTNFPALVSFAKTHQFNTIFFQVYRSGQLLFSTSDLEYFVEAASLDNLSLFYSLYFTNSTRTDPQLHLQSGRERNQSGHVDLI